MTPVFCVVLVGLLGCLLGSCLERKDWHEGHCPRCGSPWRFFDCDSQGGRGYKCDCGRYIWLSWPGIDVVKS